MFQCVLELLSLGTTGMLLLPSALHLPLRYFRCIDENPSLVFSRLNSSSFPALPQRKAAPNSSNHLCGPLVHSPIPSTLLRVCWAQSCELCPTSAVPEEGSPPFTCWPRLLLMEPRQDTTSLLCCRGTVLAHGQLGVHQDSQGLSCQAAFQLGRPLHTLVPRVVPSQCRTWHFPLLNYRRSLSAHLSSLTKHWLWQHIVRNFRKEHKIPELL